MDKINEFLAKEQENLGVLKEKRQKLDAKIRASEEKIQKYNMMLNQKKFSEVTDVLNTSGLSLEEVLAAIRTGDVLSLQERLEEKEKVATNRDGNSEGNQSENGNTI